MFKQVRRRRAQNQALLLAAGAAVGGIIALLYAPKKGKELRHDIKNEIGTAVNQIQQKSIILKDNTRVAANDLLNKTGKFISSSGKIVEEGFNLATSSLQFEISNFRRALNSAIQAYRNYSNKAPVNNRPKRIENVFTPGEIDFIDDTLPKFESMGRRQE